MSEPSDFTLLIVDDEEEIRDYLKLFLQREGFNILTAAGGNEALEVLESHSVHLIISDVRLANGSGFELLDKIQTRTPPRPSLIFLTGYSDISEENAIKRGAKANFSKPVDRTELLQTIKILLNL